LSIEHAVVVSIVAPRSLLIRSIILAGLLAPWVWLVAIDRLLHAKR